MAAGEDGNLVPPPPPAAFIGTWGRGSSLLFLGGGRSLDSTLVSMDIKLPRRGCFILFSTWPRLTPWGWPCYCRAMTEVLALLSVSSDTPPGEDTALPGVEWKYSLSTWSLLTLPRGCDLVTSEQLYLPSARCLTPHCQGKGGGALLWHGKWNSHHSLH